MYYLDYASTAANMDPEALEAMINTLVDYGGNPSTRYELGNKSKELLQKSKKILSNIINCAPEQIIFTSGASEGIATALHQHISAFMVPIEHHAFLANNKSIVLDNIEDLEFLSPGDTAELILVNNITGHSYYNEIIKLSHKASYLICDCTQALGHVPVDVQALGCDIAIFSAHKFGGPKGVGFIYVKNSESFKPLIFGSQNNNLRGGTENTAGIYSMAIAAKNACQNLFMKMNKTSASLLYLKESIIKELELQGIDNDSVIWLDKLQDLATDIHACSPNILSFCLKDVNSEIIQMVLDEKSIFIGTGSACNGASKEEPTLDMLKIPEEYYNGLIRISIGAPLNMGDCEYLAKEIVAAYISCKF